MKIPQHTRGLQEKQQKDIKSMWPILNLRQCVYDMENFQEQDSKLQGVPKNVNNCNDL